MSVIEIYNKPDHLQLQYVEGPSAGLDHSLPKSDLQVSYETPDKLILMNSVNVLNLRYEDISTMQPAGHTSLAELGDLLTDWISGYKGIDVYATPQNIFIDSEMHCNSIENVFHTKVTGSGALIEFNDADHCVDVISGISDTGRAFIQTKEYITHYCGSTLYVIFTCVLRTEFMFFGNQCMVGVFDDMSDKDVGADCVGFGMCLLIDENGELSLVWRETNDGVQSDTIIPQLEWNVDIMNGCTGSSINLNPSTINTYVIQINNAYIQFGIMYNQRFYPAHMFNNQNNNDTLVNIQRLHVPFRLESQNSAADSSSTSKLYSMSISTDARTLMYDTMYLSANSGSSVTTIAASSSAPLITLSNRGGATCRLNVKTRSTSIYSSTLARYRLISNATLGESVSWTATNGIAYYDTAAINTSGGVLICSGYLKSESIDIPCPCVLYSSIDGTSGDSLTVILDNMDTSTACEAAASVRWSEY